jgi:hypothetical protein
MFKLNMPLIDNMRFVQHRQVWTTLVADNLNHSRSSCVCFPQILLFMLTEYKFVYICMSYLP